MQQDIYNGAPGLGPTKELTHRQVFLGQEKFLPGSFIIDGEKSRDAANDPVTLLRAGLLLGRNSTSKKFQPSIVGLSTSAYADDETTIGVSLATATEIARLKTVGGGGNLSMKFIGPPSAAGTVAATAITVTAVTLNGASSTITVGDLGLDKVTGSLLTLADGSEAPVTLLYNGYPIRAVDINGDDRDLELGRYAVAGLIDTSQIINWPADTSTRQWIVDQLNAVGQFIFDHKHGA